MNLLSILAEQNMTGSQGATGIVMIVVYVVILGGFMYFMMIKPQKKQQKEISSMIEAMEVGDSVLTSSGFYGIVIDINEEIAIVEFGNNKNCRIPMKKTAIIEVEKAADGIEIADK
ncbi:MAG: preprotein translocase subunit YajC [Lachnospiraceae bacterium]|nr:preprotein translocase subunit YajC [Lachnospiraceae bacterium]